MDRLFKNSRHSTDRRGSHRDNSANMSNEDVNSSGSDQEHDMVNSLQETSVFSQHQTFDSYSTNPTTQVSSSFRYQKGLSALTEDDEDDGLSQPGGFLSNIDNVGKPLRVISSDRYDLLTRSNTNTSIGGSSIRKGSTTSGDGRKDSDSAGTSGGAFAGISTETREAISLKKTEQELALLSDSLLELMDRVNQNVVNISRASISLVELLDETFGFEPYKGPSLTVENNESLRNILKVILQFHDTFLRFEVYENSKNLLKRSLKQFLHKLGFKIEENSFGTIPFVKNFSIDNNCGLPNVDSVKTILDRILDSSSSMISDQEGAFIAPILRGLTKQSSIISIMFGFPDPQSDHYDIINALFQTFPDIHFFIKKDYIKPCAGKSYKFVPPFRIPNQRSPEISVSISSANGIKSSGTLGGYIAPKFTTKTDKSLLKYKGSHYALTCAHVLLGEDQDYPITTVPSSVLMNAYKNALDEEKEKYQKDTIEYKAYEAELINCDEKYSLKLGQVIWGERILIKNKISDIAIVKIDDSIKKVENSLGEDPQIPVNFKFKNGFIKKVIPTSQFKTYSRVFKIGSKTKYTSGDINGMKIIYWQEGHIQTSEFVISSPEPIFANGGDSGSLILHDMANETGLGVVGMLHAYDGELKQFGLFTPIEDVLGRLKEVTGLEWVFI